jgi:hypothetical protein
MQGRRGLDKGWTGSSWRVQGAHSHSAKEVRHHVRARETARFAPPCEGKKDRIPCRPALFVVGVVRVVIFVDSNPPARFEVGVPEAKGKEGPPPRFAVPRLSYRYRRTDHPPAVDVDEAGTAGQVPSF